MIFLVIREYHTIFSEKNVRNDINEFEKSDGSAYKKDISHGKHKGTMNAETGNWGVYPLKVWW